MRCAPVLGHLLWMLRWLEGARWAPRLDQSPGLQPRHRLTVGLPAVAVLLVAFVLVFVDAH
eukprot:4424470-Prymnesium_polylepis.1